jgi:hypothetical protein
VWWANLPNPVGRLPVLLLSRNAAYAVRASVIVAPLTRTVCGLALVRAPKKDFDWGGQPSPSLPQPLQAMNRRTHAVPPPDAAAS